MQAPKVCLPLHSEIEQMKLKKQKNYTIRETLTNCSLTIETGGTDQIVHVPIEKQKVLLTLQVEKPVTKLYSLESLTL